MIYSEAQARQRAAREYAAEHRYDHLIGKTLTWVEVCDDGSEETISSPIIKVSMDGTRYWVNESDEPRWIFPQKYVKDIRVQQ